MNLKLMSNPKTLPGLCEPALSCGAESIEVEYKDAREWVLHERGDIAFRTANFASSSREAKELLENLYAARKKPVLTAIGGQVWILKAGIYDSFGEDAFRVRIDPAPKLDRSVMPPFTKKQGQYLAFIYNYSKIHGRAPAESDLQRYLHHAAVGSPATGEFAAWCEHARIAHWVGPAETLQIQASAEAHPVLQRRGGTFVRFRR